MASGARTPASLTSWSSLPRLRPAASTWRKASQRSSKAGCSTGPGRMHRATDGRRTRSSPLGCSSSRGPIHALTLTTALADPPRPSPCPQPNRDTLPINRVGHATQHVGGSPTMTHGQAMRELCTMLQRTFDVASPVERFRGFVTACHLALDDLPAHLHDALTRQSIAAPDSRERWDQAMSRFTPATIEACAHGFAVWLKACRFLSPGQPYDHAGGPDVIGSVDTDLLTGRSNRWHDTAQFFTPWNIAYAMALMSGAGELEARFHAAVKPHLADDPALFALTLAATIGGPERYGWWLSRAWPRL